ncbi:MAG TPA: DUF3048 domain-containing protein [Acidimicrobiales bacterium]|nr:DUF3048 domain-containing protein [Acidimicrobiales bacterium]
MPDHAKASRNPLSNLSRNQWIAVGVVVAVLGAVIGIVATSGSSPTKSAGGPTTSSSTTTTLPKLGRNICPLTDLPAAGGLDPQRPATLVKIGNEPGTGLARPQGGLNEADIVFDTPAEGFIMRYMAVYQCNNATAIGPTRSVRWVDYHLARMFLHPILAFAGGIDPNVNQVLKDKWIEPADLIGAQSNAAGRVSTRSGDDSLFTSTAQLYGLYKKAVEPPPPVFQFGASIPASAAPTATAQINFSSGTDVVWKWNAAGNDWIHSYTDTGTDTDTDNNQPVTTTNIVEMVVSYRIGPYSEHGGPGNGDVESQTVGFGQGYVLRNGKHIAVTWHRKDLISGLSFTDAQGNAVTLAPGRTWVELIPDIVAHRAGNITFTS